MSITGVKDVPEIIDELLEEDFDWKESSRKAIAGGVYMKYDVAGSFSFQPELLFVMKGFGAKYTEDTASIEIDAKFNYIEVPLIARFAIPLEGAFNPWFCFGPSVGFNMSRDFDAKIKINGVEFADLSGDIDDVTNKIEYSLILGGGFDYDIGAGVLTFDIRYEMGLSKLIKSGESEWELEAFGETNKETIEIDEQKTKNKSFIVMVGYSF